MRARRPIWLATYEGVAADVSDELGSLITSVVYTDHVQGKSDELELTVFNGDLRWLNGWYPSEGDRIEMKIGWDDGPLLPCGAFKVDKISMSGTADTVTIHALAAGMGEVVRTKTNRAFQLTTLRGIADVIARELGLELDGDVADVYIGRVSQDQETTLAFLRRLSAEYGYAFSIRDRRLTFYSIAELEKNPPAFTLARKDLRPGYRFEAKTMGTYVACEVSFLDPATKETMHVRVEAEQARERIVIVDSARANAAPKIPTRTLKVGDNGDDVRAWQKFLAANGHDPGPIDGIFGPLTRAATVSFQRAGGLVPDGIAGSESMRVAVGQGFDLAQSVAAPATHSEIAGNVLRQAIRVESVAQAELKAKALLAAANRLKATGSISLTGDTRVMAGVNLELADMGRLSGRYTIDSSKHRMTRSGYETDAEVKFVP